MQNAAEQSSSGSSNVVGKNRGSNQQQSATTRGASGAKKVNQSNNSKALQKQPTSTTTSSSSNNHQCVGSGSVVTSVSGNSKSCSGVGNNGVGTAAGSKGNPSNPKQQQNNLCRVQPEVTTPSATAGSGSNAKTMSAATSNNNNNTSGANRQQQQQSSGHSSPAKSDTETTFSEFQPRVSDSSESDEESVSEILLACLCLRPDLLVDSFPLDQQSIEIPETECSDSCENDVDMDESDSCDNDADDNEDSEDDEEEDDDIHSSTVVAGKFLLDQDDDQESGSGAGGGGAGGGGGGGGTGSHDKKARLEALLEAADEAAQALTRMRSSEGGGSPRDKNLLSRSLLAACTDNDVNTVRRLLGEGNSLNEATDDGDSLLSLACSTCADIASRTWASS